eukprot:m.478347 g.478347  ORF g.478347 m.478347 type:complete len:298 (-) comp57169_c0_seq12:346-1239(-)
MLIVIDIVFCSCERFGHFVEFVSDLLLAHLCLCHSATPFHLLLEFLEFFLFLLSLFQLGQLWIKDAPTLVAMHCFSVSTGVLLAQLSQLVPLNRGLQRGLLLDLSGSGEAGGQRGQFCRNSNTALYTTPTTPTYANTHKHTNEQKGTHHRKKQKGTHERSVSPEDTSQASAARREPCEDAPRRGTAVSGECCRSAAELRGTARSGESCRCFRGTVSSGESCRCLRGTSRSSESTCEAGLAVWSARLRRLKEAGLICTTSASSAFAMTMLRSAPIGRNPLLSPVSTCGASSSSSSSAR